MDAKFQALLEKILAQRGTPHHSAVPKNLRVRALELWRGELAPAPVASAVSAETWLRRLWAPSLGDSRHKATEEDPLELAEKLGPEPVEAKKPEPLRRRLVLTEDSDGP